MPERKIIKCPFCEKGDVVTIHIPRMMVTKYGRAAHSKKPITYYKDEKWIEEIK